MSAINIKAESTTTEKKQKSKKPKRSANTSLIQTEPISSNYHMKMIGKWDPEKVEFIIILKIRMFSSKLKLISHLTIPGLLLVRALTISIRVLLVIQSKKNNNLTFFHEIRFDHSNNYI